MPTEAADHSPGVPRSRAVLVVVAAAALSVLGTFGALAALVGLPQGTSASGIAAAQGDGYAVWGVNDDGYPIRWDPCSPVPVVVNPAGAPPGALDDLATAMTRIAELTGLRLALEGEVDERPGVSRGAYLPDRYGQRWAPVLVAWDDPGVGGLPLRNFDRGIAVPVAVGEPGNQVFVSGQVVLNRSRGDLRPGFADRRDSWGATLLHELGHLLGLDHVDDPTQLMHRFPGYGPVELGEGDRAGLAAVGADTPCLDVPPAQPVEVELTVVR